MNDNVVPVGYKLVPINPTPQMVHFGSQVLGGKIRPNTHDSRIAELVYKAMIGAVK